MIDPNRLKRLHVYNVYFHNNIYHVVLKVGEKDEYFEVTWDQWNNLDFRAELIRSNP